MIRHERGYRSQFAYPLSLGTRPSLWDAPWCGTCYDDDKALLELRELEILRKAP